MFPTLVPARRMRRYGCALAASAAAAFFVSVGPAHWTRSLCDAIAFNSAAALVAGAVVLAVAGSFPGKSIALRAAAIAAAAVASLAVLIASEPRCLAGPYAMVDPAIWPIWLGRCAREPATHACAVGKSPHRRRHRGLPGGGLGRGAAVGA
jgi:hypothetical protein